MEAEDHPDGADLGKVEEVHDPRQGGSSSHS